MSTAREAHAVLAQANPPTITPLRERYAWQNFFSAYGGVPQRWVLLSSEHRRPQAQRAVNKY